MRWQDVYSKVAEDLQCAPKRGRLLTEAARVSYNGHKDAIKTVSARYDTEGRVEITFHMFPDGKQKKKITV